MSKADIRLYVINEYIKNNGNHLFISDIARACKTNAKGVRAALDESLNGFDYFEADKWSGCNFSGRYIQSWAVEPSKTLLLSMIIQKVN
jgi:hypothetical protein